MSLSAQLVHLAVTKEGRGVERRRVNIWRDLTELPSNKSEWKASIFLNIADQKTIEIFKIASN